MGSTLQPKFEAGQIYGNFTILLNTGKLENHSRVYLVKCVCLKVLELRSYQIRNNLSCGCLKGFSKRYTGADLRGKRYGRLVVLERVENLKPNGKFAVKLYECICDCGKKTTVRAGNLTRKGAKTSSCGCYSDEVRGQAVFLGDGVASFNALCQSYRKRARERNLEFTLTKDRLFKLFSSPCYYCGNLPTPSVYSDGSTPFICNGIDRLNSTKGYTYKNCVSACFMCNSGKTTKTKREFLKLVKMIYKNRIAGMPVTTL